MVKVAVQLLAELAAMTLKAQIQLVVHAGKLAQTDQQRTVHPNCSKTMPVCPQRICQDESISPVIFCAGREIAIAESIQLFRINGKYAESTFLELFH